MMEHFAVSYWLFFVIVYLSEHAREICYFHFVTSFILLSFNCDGQKAKVGYSLEIMSAVMSYSSMRRRPCCILR